MPTENTAAPAETPILLQDADTLVRGDRFRFPRFTLPGEPVKAETGDPRITITVSGVAGTEAVTLPLGEWDAMAPITKVLTLHEMAEESLRGRPFDVLSERRTA